MLRYKTETQPLQTTHKHTLGINVIPKVKRLEIHKEEAKNQLWTSECFSGGRCHRIISQ